MHDGTGYTEAGGFAEVIEIAVDRIRRLQRFDRIQRSMRRPRHVPWNSPPGLSTPDVIDDVGFVFLKVR
jgi:hypothetical protein